MQIYLVYVWLNVRFRNHLMGKWLRSCPITSLQAELLTVVRAGKICNLLLLDFRNPHCYNDKDRRWLTFGLYLLEISMYAYGY